MTEVPEKRLAPRAILQRLFSRTGFRGPVLTLLSGAGVALVITYASQLVLARLYPPDAFGVSDYFVMAVTVLLAFASLRYEDAVMIPASDAAAKQILVLALVLTAVACAVLGIAAVWSDAIASVLGVPELAAWFWLIPVTLLLTKSVRLVELWLSRRNQFRTITGGQVSAAGATAAYRIGAGVAAPTAGAGGLIGGFVAGQVADLAFVAIARRNAPQSTAVSDEDAPPTLPDVARKYRHFAGYSTPAAVLNAAFSRLPTILLPLYFSWTVVGYYGRAFAALAVPLGLVGNAVAQVFFVHAGEAMRAGTMGRLSAQVHGRLVMIGLLPTIAVMIAGPDLFEVLFGQPWRPSGEYLRYVAPWMFLAAIAAPLTKIFDVLQQQRADFLSSVAMFCLQTAALVVGGTRGDVMLALILLGATGFLARAGHVSVMLGLAGTGLRDALLPYGRYGLRALLPAAAILLATFFAPPVVTVVVTFLALGSYYGFIAWNEGVLVDRQGQ
ncbi:MAG TPA: oligosaccharide flippase family protein [Rhodothermales bacterium]